MTKSVDEIAKMAGVSVTSVRLVINGQDKKYRISEKTRKRIQDIIDEHGYSINQTARSLKLQRTLTLGLVVPHLTTPFFSQLAEQLETRCKAMGYQLITVCSGDQESIEEEITKNLISRGVDGLFVTSSSAQRQNALLADSNRKPIIFIDRDFGAGDSFVTVSDNQGAGLLLGSAMAVELGSGLYVLGGNNFLPTIQECVNGLREGLRQAGYQLNEENIRIDGIISTHSGYDDMRQLCEQLGTPPRAIVTLALPQLEGALQYLKGCYGKIPGDMLIGSFDYHTMLDFLPNKVFSIRQNAEQLAERAQQMMSDLIGRNTPNLRKQVVSTELIRHFS